MFIDPIRPHFFQGHVWREICIDDDATHRVGALDDRLRRYEPNAVRQRVYADKPGYVVPPILQGVGIKFPDYRLSSATLFWYKRGTFCCFCGFERMARNKVQFQKGLSEAQFATCTEQRIGAARC